VRLQSVADYDALDVVYRPTAAFYAGTVHTEDVLHIIISATLLLLLLLRSTAAAAATAAKAAAACST
jgi:hypothetical protein